MNDITECYKKRGYTSIERKHEGTEIVLKGSKKYIAIDNKNKYRKMLKRGIPLPRIYESFDCDKKEIIITEQIAGYIRFDDHRREQKDIICIIMKSLFLLFRIICAGYKIVNHENFDIYNNLVETSKGEIYLLNLSILSPIKDFTNIRENIQIMNIVPNMYKKLMDNVKTALYTRFNFFPHEVEPVLIDEVDRLKREFASSGDVNKKNFGIVKKKIHDKLEKILIVLKSYLSEEEYEISGISEYKALNNSLRKHIFAGDLRGMQKDLDDGASPNGKERLRGYTFLTLVLVDAATPELRKNMTEMLLKHGAVPDQIYIDTIIRRNDLEIMDMIKNNVYTSKILKYYHAGNFLDPTINFNISAEMLAILASINKNLLKINRFEELFCDDRVLEGRPEYSLVYFNYIKNALKVNPKLATEKITSDYRDLGDLLHNYISKLLNSKSLPNPEFAEKKIGILLDNGADINSKDTNGRTVLHLVAYNDKMEKIAEILLARGANPNSVDHDMITPLHLAVLNQSKNILQLLINYNGDPNIKDEDGRTLVDILNYILEEPSDDPEEQKVTEEMKEIIESGPNMLKEPDPFYQ